MINEQELVVLLQSKLKQAEESRTRIRKRVNAGHAHGSYLAYADGLADGIESAIVAIVWLSCNTIQGEQVVS